MNKTIEELKDEKRYGTAHVYQSTLNAFCEFCGCNIVYFHQLNRATLKEFETHLRDKQLSWNTVSTYMRTLRGAYNKAVDQKITTGNSRLFKHGNACAVTLYYGYVKVVCKLLAGFLFLFNNGYIVSLFNKNFGQIVAYLSAAYYKRVHFTDPFCRLCQMAFENISLSPSLITTL